MLRYVITCSLLFLGINFGVLPLASINAQNPSAETYQPGFWQPVARVNVNQPISIKIKNQSGIPVEYELTDKNTQPIIIQPSNISVIKNVQPSEYIVVYPYIQNFQGARVYLRYEVVTKNNTIELTVRTTNDGNKSHRAFNLQETGAIYLY